MRKIIYFVFFVSLCFCEYYEVNTTDTNYTLMNNDCIKDLTSNNTYCWGIILKNETVVLNYSQNYTTIDNITVISNATIIYNITNITNITNCSLYNDTINLSENGTFYDEAVNRTYKCEIKQFNDLINLTAGENYSDIMHNRSFICGYRKYNVVHNANCGQVINYDNENISFIAPACLNCSCLENVSKNLSFREMYRNEKCNISIFAPAFPMINEDYLANYGSFRIFDEYNLTIRGPVPCKICEDKTCPVCESYNQASFILEPNQTKNFELCKLSVTCKERTLEDWFSLFYYNKTYECNESERIVIWSDGKWVEICKNEIIKFCTPEEIMRKDGVLGVCLPRIMQEAKEEASKCNATASQSQGCSNVPSAAYYGYTPDTYEQFKDLCGGSMLIFTVIGWGVIIYNYLVSKGHVSAIAYSQDKVMS